MPRKISIFSGYTCNLIKGVFWPNSSLLPLEAHFGSVQVQSKPPESPHTGRLVQLDAVAD